MSFSLFYKRFEDESQPIKDKRKQHSAVDKRFSEQRFLKSNAVTFLSEKTGALAIVEQDLTAVRQAGRKADETVVK